MEFANVRDERYYGAILFIEEDGVVRYLVVKYTDNFGGLWDFPKGHIEENMSDRDLAVRAVRIELGLSIGLLDGFREIIREPVEANVTKDVVLFLAKADKSALDPEPGEIAEYKWLEFDEALNTLSLEPSKNALKNAHRFVEENKNKM